jgi:hypothetical protein
MRESSLILIKRMLSRLLFLKRVKNWPPDIFSCEVCSRTKEYNEKYDAFFCSFCNEWKEKECGDPECEYCAQRPPTPGKKKG